MPQLMPDPWLYIFIFSWLIIITVMPKKVLNHKMVSLPSTKPLDSYDLKDWSNDWS